MTEVWWLAIAFVVVYLALGAVAAPGIVAKIDRRRRPSHGGPAASFLAATRSGRLAVVLLWPLIAWAAHWGFLFGLSDWKGDAPGADRR